MAFVLHKSADQIKKTEMGRACSTYRGGEVHTGVLMGKPEGRRSLERPKHRWEDNIKPDF